MKTTKHNEETRAGSGGALAAVAAGVAVIAAAFGLSASNGCSKGEGLGEPYDDGVGLETDGVMDDGYSWCMRAIGAKLIVPGPDPDVVDPADGNQAPKGCFCASADEHAGLDTLDMDGNWSVLVPDGTSDDLDQLRNSIRFNAVTYCDQVADTQGGNQFPNTCDTVLDDTKPLFIKVNPPGAPDCIAPERIGTGPGMQYPPSDGYSDYYSLSSAITYNSAQGRYYVDDAFFYDVRENPGWLLDDTARIVSTTGTPPYKFTITGTAGIAYKLGIRNNDRPVSINGYTLSRGMIDAVKAYEALKTTTVFTFIVKRGTSNVTLRYTVQ